MTRPNNKYKVSFLSSGANRDHEVDAPTRTLAIKAAKERFPLGSNFTAEVIKP